MRSSKSPRPAGSSREAQFAKSTWDRTQGPAAQFADSATVKWSRTTRGIMAHVKPGKKSTPALLFPFKVMASPADPAHPESSWRTFRVRAGRYLDTEVSGTDGADINPDDESVNPTPDYDNAVDFVVPDSTSIYYVYIDATGASPVIGHDTAEPTWSDGYMKIAEIDTLTKHSEQTAIVRQLVRADVTTPLSLIWFRYKDYKATCAKKKMQVLGTSPVDDTDP